ncbi:MAG: dethiobiotin synthase [Thermodesulfovibrionales bacterium]
MPKGFFVTGTDTGVGKTVVSAALIRLLMFHGRSVFAMKPIESGCGRHGDTLIPFDGMFLKQTAHMPEAVSSVTPCCFESPLSPFAASEREPREINPERFRKTFYRLFRKYDTAVVEGIGGLMVPIRSDYFVVDLAREFNLPLIVVARPGLGTLNHTMLTVTCALREGLKVAGVVINYANPPENTEAEKTNVQVLRQICPAPVIGELPHIRSLDEDVLQKTALRNLDAEMIKKYLL